MLEDRVAPWDRQPWETTADYRLFQLYLEQDNPRSVNEAYRKARARKGNAEVKAKQAPGSFRNLAMGKRRNGDAIPGSLSWIARANAWDDHVADLEKQKWLKRRLEIKEKEWETGSKLLQRGQEMLQFPVMTVESDDGRTVIVPAGWRLKDVPTILSTGSKLVRLAADMVTDRVEVDWRNEARKEGVDPDAIFTELVDKLTASLERGNDERGMESGQGESQPQEG